MKRAFLFGLILLFPCVCHAQTLDSFLGRTDVPCPTPPHYLAFTSGTLSGTSGTVTVTSASTIYAAGEPLIITGSGTALDWANDNTDVNRGAAIITGVVGNVISFTNHVSGTVASATGFVQPGRAHFETITTPYGTGQFYCTPQNHWIYLQGMAEACAGIGPLGGGNCSINNVNITSASAAGGVVTMTDANNPTVSTLGEIISVSGCSDANYNGTFQIQSLPAANQFTYNDALAGASATGCKFSGSGWRSKYTTDCTTAQNEIKRFRDWGLNSIWEDSDSQFIAGNGTCSYTGFIPDTMGVIVIAQNLYSSVNLFGDAAQPTLFMTVATSAGSQWGFDRVWAPQIRGSANNLDWFNSYFSTFFLNHWGSTNTIISNTFKSPLSAFVLTDDSDHQNLTLDGAFFPTFPRGKNDYNAAFMVATTDPYQSYSSAQAQIRGSVPSIYPDNVFHAKRLSAVAPSGCWLASNPSQFSPCTLPDFARFTYGTVSSMNSAWSLPACGSGGYCSFGSTESVNTQVVELTGDGTTTTASLALGANVTPGSVQVYMKLPSGSAIDVGGDCPAMWNGCGGAAGTGTFYPAPLCSSFLNVKVQSGFVCADLNNDIESIATGGTTGASNPSWPPETTACSGTNTVWGGVTATCLGAKISLSGGSITLNYATGNGSVSFAIAQATGVQILLSWTTGGWDAGGTGLADEDGSGAQVGANPICLVQPPNWKASTAYTAYDQNSIFVDPVTSTWQIFTTTGTTASTAPSFSAIEGTSVTDSSGMTAVSFGQPICAASGADINTPITANQNYAAFLESWLTQYAAQYFKTEYNDSKTLWPDLINLGTDFSLMSYRGPEDSNTMIAESAYTDGAFTGSAAYFSGNTYGSSGNMSSVVFHHIVHYYHKPIMELRIWMLGTNTDNGAQTWQNQFSASGGCDGVSQLIPPDCWRSTSSGSSPLILRSQGYYSQTLQELSLKNENNQLQYAGWGLWASHDNQRSPMGIIDNLDNAPDGNEDVAPVVSCSGSLSAFNCGGELASAPWLGVDAINCSQCLKAATALWLTQITTVPVVPTGKQPALAPERK